MSENEKEFENMAKSIGGTVIKLAPLSSLGTSHFNPFEVSDPITNDMIIEKMQYVKEILKIANPTELTMPEQILEAICIKNKIELIEEEKNDILKKFNNHDAKQRI